MLEKKIKISMLLDFYSQLLTEKQKEMIELYYDQDLSFGEIAEEYNISRQAVYDTIKRTEKILYDYETKLKLIHLFHCKIADMEKIFEKVLKLEKKIESEAEKEELMAGIHEIKLSFKDILNHLS